MGCYLCIWRGMRRCRGPISRLRRSSRARRTLCYSSRMSNIGLRPRGGLGGHSAMLQLGNARSRTRYCGMSRNPMIHRSKIGFILFRNLRMLLLGQSRLKVRLTHEGLLLRCRFRGNSIRSTVEARMIVIDDRSVVYHRCIHICRPNHGRVHVHCRAVVSEDASAPLTTGKAASTITESIVHAPVEAYLCSPVACMEDVNTSISPAPIARCPKIARLRSEHPGTRDPIVVADVIPGPIAGRPHVVGFWTGRLNVNRKSRRTDIDADPD
jgi:hypothetical protein